MRTVAFCEIDPFCRRVLEKHWPGVPAHSDVRTLRGADVGAIDVICGGFPCQDISLSGTGAGIEGARSGLWSEYARIIGELRPKYVIVENVSALLGRGLDRVLGDLASLGYDAEWHCIPASAVGAPHRRDRIWIVAYPNNKRSKLPVGNDRKERSGEWNLSSRRGEDMANANTPRLEIVINGQARQFAPAFGAHEWSSEPDVGRVAYGVPDRVDRLQSLGNAVVPQIPEIIGRAIMKAANADVR